MERDTWRDDDYREKQIFYSVCKSCDWEEEESHGVRDECTTVECPECGSDYIVDEMDYV